MGRNFPNFLEAYFKYAQDGFCPDEFQMWTGISILAGAVQRKVSLREGKTHYVPNLYVMLVSHPAVGKSTALERGTEILEEMAGKNNPEFKVIPNQTTEAALVQIMDVVESFSIPGTSIHSQHSSGYFYASEASASALQNVCGDFVSTMTAFYDCPTVFRKKLKGDKFTTTIRNSCMNLLAGSTFEYLKTLVNDTTVMGGFASRIIYVVNKERKVVETKWGETSREDLDTKKKLVEDLAHIHKLIGPMNPTKEFTERVDKWRPKFSQYLKDLNSPRMESIMGRKGTHLIKLSMLLSLAERDDLVINAGHFERAKEMIDRVTADNAFIISSAMIANKDSQAGLNQLILRSMGKKGDTMSPSRIRQLIIANGNDLAKLDTTLKTLVEARCIEMTSIEGELKVRLLVDPNANL